MLRTPATTETKFRGFQIWICHLCLTTCSIGSYPMPFLHAEGHRLFFSVPPGGHKFRLFWTKVCCSTVGQSQERCPGHPSLVQRSTQELQPAIRGILMSNFEVSWEFVSCLETRLTNGNLLCPRFVYSQVENSC